MCEDCKFYEFDEWRKRKECSRAVTYYQNDYKWAREVKFPICIHDKIHDDFIKEDYFRKNR